MCGPDRAKATPAKETWHERRSTGRGVTKDNAARRSLSGHDTSLESRGGLVSGTVLPDRYREELEGQTTEGDGETRPRSSQSVAVFATKKVP